MIFNINSTRGQTRFLTFVAQVTFPYCSTTSCKSLGLLTFDGEGYKLELCLLVYCVTGGGDSVYCVTGGGDSVYCVTGGGDSVYCVTGGGDSVYCVTGGGDSVYCVTGGGDSVYCVTGGGDSVYCVTGGGDSVYCVTGGGDSVYCVTGGGDSGPGDGHIQSDCQSSAVPSRLSHLQEVRRSSQDQTGSYAQGKHSPCIVSHVESCIRKSVVGSNIQFNSALFSDTPIH